MPLSSHPAGTEPPRANNVLVIMLRYIGDVLLTTPVLRALRIYNPAAKISVLVNRGTEEVLKQNPDLDEVILIERGGLRRQAGFLWELRRRRFDCVIDLTDGDRAAMATLAAGARLRVGFNPERYWRGLIYSHVVTDAFAGRHRIERNLAALRAIGIEPKPTTPVLRTSDDADAKAEALLREFGLSVGNGAPPLVMLQPGARYWFKAWSEERFAELADRLTTALNCRILIGGSPSEQALASRIQTLCHCSVTPLAGRTGVSTYIALVKRCALFVGNDNGPMHIAAALGVPVVGLFGPSNPAEWGPRGGPVTMIYKGLDCRRCFHPTCFRGEERCMKLITVEEVFAAAMRLLGKHV